MISFAATLGSATLTDLTWLTISMLCFALLVGVSAIVAYFYFAKTEPDSLRSERFSLSKMAIEKGIIGDNTTGTFEEIETVSAIEPASVRSLPSSEEDQSK